MIRAPLRLVQTPAGINWLGERITGPRRFSISVTHPDGRCEHYQRTGGSSMDHTSEALRRFLSGRSVRFRAPYERHLTTLNAPEINAPSSFARGFHVGLLTGATAGGALIGFALWIGIALGSSL